MAGDQIEAIAALRRRLEEEYGVAGAAHLLDSPPGGWESLVTTEHLRAELADFRAELRAEIADLRTELVDVRIEFHRQVTRLVMWLVPSVFAGIAAAGGIAAAVR